MNQTELKRLISIANSTNDVHAQLQAAYACDKLGKDSQAVKFYEKADTLRVPDSDLKKFLICYSSTLNNLGRHEEALSRLRRAAKLYPRNSEIWAFFALAQRSAGNHDNAFRALLKATVLEAGKSGLGGFSRAVSEYLDKIGDPDTA